MGNHGIPSRAPGFLSRKERGQRDRLRPLLGIPTRKTVATYLRPDRGITEGLARGR